MYHLPGRELGGHSMKESQQAIGYQVAVSNCMVLLTELSTTSWTTMSLS
jgi:hypothetical protein